jgi:hypothetical protein
MVMLKGSMSTEEQTLQVSALPYRCSICPPSCVCHGCCPADFGRFGGTYELPCIIVRWVVAIKTKNKQQKMRGTSIKITVATSLLGGDHTGSAVHSAPCSIVTGDSFSRSEPAGPSRPTSPFSAHQYSAEPYLHHHTFPQGLHRKQFTYINITCLEILVKLDNTYSLHGAKSFLSS